MIDLDYIIVGSGIAGVCFSEFALKNEKKIVVFENESQPSSRVAAGLYNPVVLKRFSEVWKAKEQLELAMLFYTKIEQNLSAKINFKVPIYRKLASIEEQNNWFQAADKPNLSSFLSTSILSNSFQYVNAPLGYGEVLNTGYVDIKLLVSRYAAFLEEKRILIKESFDYSKIKFLDNEVVYNQYKTKHIIFAEGFGMHSNPFFNELPLDGTKGELLLIKAKDLKVDVTIKSSVFILPIGNDFYKVGATYDWVDKTNLPTKEGKDELIEKLEEVINCEYEIIEHLAGVRPTVKDRRPLVGTHFENKNLHVLNGLGTRGVMLGPFLAKQLFDNIENNKPLEKEIDVDRFYKKRG
ncbi:FAD-binding oxidoreductase [Flavobacterium sediminilitoris]|uniref:FAD-binding oxidoreductase n=1 Tax=Flavobacterium sediminilitoris TaxID=2024526 RepID=A0ABY4HSL1_9FLAO|nr:MULTISPECIES: FAD-dependent oxidoreductase [Flavobacterium]UOX35600.1 FAD-binding oxidoreductase [Flavobacterium sediminilitoris]